MMIDSPIGPLSAEDVVQGYIRYSYSLRSDDPDAIWDPTDPDTAAYTALDEQIRNGPAGVAWDLVLRVLTEVPDEELDNFSAGLLEDLVRLRGADLIDRIESEAERDDRFRWALGCIWLSEEELPDEVLERVVRASGGAIKPLPPLRVLQEGWPIEPVDEPDHAP